VEREGKVERRSTNGSRRPDCDGTKARGYSRSDGSGGRSSQNVSSTGVLLLTTSDLAFPNTNVGPLDRGLTTSGARVLGVLSDFHLLDARELKNEARTVD
jgi:hypothetical protein